MKSFGFSAVMVVLMATSGTAYAAGDSGRVISSHTVVTQRPAVISPTVQQPRSARSWGEKRDGRWIGGADAPGGWTAYRPAFRGYALPSYWRQPSFAVGDYQRYGFATPQSGFAWSRYYDDAVLVDGSGRVVDTVRGVDWDRFDDRSFGSDFAGGRDFDEGGHLYDDHPGHDSRDGDRRRHRKSGVGSAIGSIGGALVGGAIGAVAGNLIAGHGERLAGSLIGGGVGALAGLAVGEATSKGKRYRGDRGRHRHEHGGDYRRDDYGYGDGYYREGGYHDETYTRVTYTPVEPIETTSTTTTVREEVVYSRGERQRVWIKKTPVRRPHVHRPRAPQCITGS